ncbi:MAG: hypothetical protein PHV30_09125 [Candidatus Margulisbacteria bacterium]|nr:hypothetical protein [Candidatus Margulisiibacteriota bacterium]
MSFATFFMAHYEGIFIVIAVICIVVIVFNRLGVYRLWKESGFSVFIFHPWLGRAYAALRVKAQRLKAKEGRDYSGIELSLGEIAKIEKLGLTGPEREIALSDALDKKKREAFREFLMDLPEYCISDGYMAGFIRKMFNRGGAGFRQVVLHNQNEVYDTTLWARKVGDYLVHDGGMYLWPWKNSKNIVHWDVDYCIPLEDFHKGAQWENPRMQARTFWSIVSKVAAGRKTEPKPDTTNFWIIVGFVAVIVVIAVVSYLQHKDTTFILNYLYALNQSKSGEIVIIGGT